MSISCDKFIFSGENIIKNYFVYYFSNYHIVMVTSINFLKDTNTDNRSSSTSNSNLNPLLQTPT